MRVLILMIHSTKRLYFEFGGIQEEKFSRQFEFTWCFVDISKVLFDSFYLGENNF